MRIAALYDIHGNLPALDAVLRDVRAARVDAIVVGGDVVPGPMSRECLERLVGGDIPTEFISGNCERELLALAAGNESTVPAQARTALRWTAALLDDDMKRAIAAWPATLRVAVRSLGTVFFCHATPRNDTGIFTRLTPEAKLRPILADARAGVIVCGHTHMQFDRTIGDIRVVNAGSVGMPFQAAGAYWLLIGDTIELRRTDYDLARAAEQIRATAYPQADDFADRHVLQPPSEQEMLTMYAKLELT
jgi:putative phosphoesterase